MFDRRAHPRIRAAISRLGLSDRQQQIAEALALGMRHDTIAQALGISRSTLRSHFRHIFSSVRVGNRVELLALIMEEVVKGATGSSEGCRFAEESERGLQIDPAPGDRPPRKGPGKSAS